jgi:hypothetical protein
MLCFSSRNMIDKTMFEVVWRNISDFYVNLRVEVAAVSRNRYGVEKTVDTHKILINAIKVYVCLHGIW